MRKSKNRRQIASKPFGYIIIFLVAFGAGYQVNEQMSFKGSSAIPIEAKENIKVYFSPRGGCTEAIVRAIDEAEQTIYVFAFSLTSKPIADALVRAYRRGVEVRILADRQQSRGRGCKLDFLRRQGIAIWIDKVSGYAHNKVVLVDNRLVITGSFNFSASAEYRNAENILVLISPMLASKYKKNWHDRIKNAYVYSNEG
ncbi:MAG: phospholipase D family protein [Bacteroidota bacterium]